MGQHQDDRKAKRTDRPSAILYGEQDQPEGLPSGAREEVTVKALPRPRPRVPCIAGALGFLVPGLGHMYAGKLRAGGVWYAAALMFPLLVATTGLQFSFHGLLSVLSFELLFSAVIMVDGARVAWRQGTVLLSPWQRWWVYGLILLLASAFSMVMQVTAERKAMGIRAFKIPSESMEPGLLIGDHVMVDISSNDGHPLGRGEIVVFRHPKQPDIFYIKRIVAVEGDTVALKDNKLYVNGAPVEEPYIHSDDSKNGHEEKSFGPVTVERGKLFLLGDNRAHSYDSRQWGTLDTSETVGRALYIYWSWDNRKKSPRMERIGMRVE